MSSKTSPEYGIAPLRSLNDFILDSARFQIPNFTDLEKWGKRVTNNLLYYQTNYFLTSIVVFFVVGVLHPTKMACGFIVTAIMFVVFCYFANERMPRSIFRRDHPIICIFLILVTAYIVLHMLDALLVFALGIFLPFSFVFIHASLRLRNIQNKVFNKFEALGLMKTPMGIFLEEFKLEPEVF